MLGLLLFTHTVDLKPFSSVVEVVPDYCLDVVITRIIGILGFVKFILGGFNIFCESFLLHVCGLVLFFMSLLFGSNFHELSSIIIEISLKFLELSSLLEKSLRGSSTLVLKNLLLLKVSSFSSSDEFVSIVLISHFKVIKSVGKSLDLSFTLS